MQITSFPSNHISSIPTFFPSQNSFYTLNSNIHLQRQNYQFPLHITQSIPHSSYPNSYQGLTFLGQNEGVQMMAVPVTQIPSQVFGAPLSIVGMEQRPIIQYYNLEKQQIPAVGYANQNFQNQQAYNQQILQFNQLQGTIQQQQQQQDFNKIRKQQQVNHSHQNFIQQENNQQPSKITNSNLVTSPSLVQVECNNNSTLSLEYLKKKNNTFQIDQNEPFSENLIRKRKGIKKTIFRDQKNQKKISIDQQPVSNENQQVGEINQGCQKGAQQGIHLNHTITQISLSSRNNVKKSRYTHSVKSKKIFKLMAKKPKKHIELLSEQKINEDKLKISLKESLNEKEQVILEKVILINRNAINRNLIKDFSDYVFQKVKYIINYDKPSETQYHFKTCQNLPLIINHSPSEKERSVFDKKFKKFLGSKTHSSKDMKQIIQNRLYGILFQEFLTQQILNLSENNESEKEDDGQLISEFYLLCFKNNQYLIFLNDNIPNKPKQALVLRKQNSNEIRPFSSISISQTLINNYEKNASQNQNLNNSTTGEKFSLNQDANEEGKFESPTKEEIQQENILKSITQYQESKFN